MLPLSAMRISPFTDARVKNERALRIQVAIVSPSFRHGIRMVSSSCWLSRSEPKAWVPLPSFARSVLINAPPFARAGALGDHDRALAPLGLDQRGLQLRPA